MRTALSDVSARSAWGAKSGSPPRRPTVAAAAFATAELLESRTLLSLAAAGAEFPVNQATTQQQRDPVVAADARGNVLLVWSSNGNTAAGANQDASGFGVYARRY